jgi:hypothetical protein
MGIWPVDIGSAFRQRVQDPRPARQGLGTSDLPILALATPKAVFHTQEFFFCGNF